MTQLRYHDGQAHVLVSESDPLPVTVKSDPTRAHIIFATGQVSVATSATQIRPANPRRRAVKITQISGSQIVYIGNSSSVSSTTGDYFSATAGSTITLYSKGPIWGIAAVGAQTCSFLEEEYADTD